MEEKQRWLGESGTWRILLVVSDWCILAQREDTSKQELRIHERSFFTTHLEPYKILMDTTEHFCAIDNDLARYQIDFLPRIQKWRFQVVEADGEVVSEEDYDTRAEAIQKSEIHCLCLTTDTVPELRFKEEMMEALRRSPGWSEALTERIKELQAL